MSYSEYIYGSIQVSPPLNWSELKDHESWTNQNASPLRLAIQETTEDSVVGIIIKRTCEEIRPAEESNSRYLKTILEKIIKTYQDHKFNGTLLIEGEEAGDVWRLRVEDNEIFEEHVTMAWPDGSTYSERG